MSADCSGWNFSTPSAPRPASAPPAPRLGLLDGPGDLGPTSADPYPVAPPRAASRALPKSSFYPGFGAPQLTPKEIRINVIILLLDSNLDYYFNYKKFNVMFNLEHFRFVNPTLKELSNVLPANRIKELEECLDPKAMEAALKKMLNYYVSKTDGNTEETPLFPNIVFNKGLK